MEIYRRKSINTSLIKPPVWMNFNSYKWGQYKLIHNNFNWIAYIENDWKYNADNFKIIKPKELLDYEGEL